MKFSHGEIVVVELKQGVITEVIDNNPPRYDVLILSENKVNNYAENEIEKALDYCKKINRYHKTK